MSKAAKLPRNVADSHVHQINVLKALSTSTTDADSNHLQINEIAAKSGLKDEKEAQRYLFILEGQKLVTPLPEGDFTSRNWQITTHGMKAIKMIHKATKAS